MEFIIIVFYIPIMFTTFLEIMWFSQVTFIAIFTIQIVSKQLHSDNMKIIQQSLFLEENCVNVHLK